LNSWIWNGINVDVESVCWMYYKKVVDVDRRLLKVVEF
jgi:hypothetical protein